LIVDRIPRSPGKINPFGCDKWEGAGSAKNTGPEAFVTPQARLEEEERIYRNRRPNYPRFLYRQSTHAE
jgi:hypothetical protein